MTDAPMTPEEAMTELAQKAQSDGDYGGIMTSQGVTLEEAAQVLADAADRLEATQGDDVAEAVRLLNALVASAQLWPNPRAIAAAMDSGEAKALSTLLASHEAQAAEIERLKAENGLIGVENMGHLRALSEHKAVLNEALKSLKERCIIEACRHDPRQYCRHCGNLMVTGDGSHDPDCIIARATALMEK